MKVLDMKVRETFVIQCGTQVFKCVEFKTTEM